MWNFNQIKLELTKKTNKSEINGKAKLIIIEYFYIGQSIHSDLSNIDNDNMDDDFVAFNVIS